ncbi:hypothetical protein LSH36_1718g00024 [Paralvinella palmiformis]|uniref:ABC transporter domain-containing protein n=1 Tax=Paralvinella palmiformis TaxID=53620 RepID=A0AAD9IRY4_9ANNE|nr:hypothetical protein LSH36_1718g00024 [Paralvinella palmiformis]
MTKMKDSETRLLLGDSESLDLTEPTNSPGTIPSYNATDKVSDILSNDGLINNKKCLSSDIEVTHFQRQVDMPSEKGGLLSCCKIGKEKVKKTILDDVSGIAKAGSLLVIMGASGSGKTTLLNCLTRRNLRLLEVEGTILVNGINIGENISGISGYIQQDDLFIGTLSVREHLWFNAVLRLKDISDVDREGRIEQVLVELLTKPSILFCDEPTSGLDSYTARNVVQSLKNLAEKGHTIICTIHQPSSEVFAMFDELLVMAEGRVAYLGSNKDALKFFSGLGLHCPPNYNPADFLINTLAVVPGHEKKSKETIKLVCNCFQESSYARRVQYLMEEQTSHKDDKFVLEMDDVINGDKGKQDYAASWWVQMKMCFWRCLTNLRRNRKVFPAKFLQLLLTGLLLGSLYWQQPYTVTGSANMNGALFMLMVQGSFNLAYSVVMIPFTIFSVFVYIACSYWMIGLYPAADAFFIAAAALIILCSTAVAYGHFAASLFRDAQLALLMLPFLLGTTLLFSGYLLKEGSASKLFKPIEWISSYRYAYEILFVNQWENVRYIACDYVTTSDSVSQSFNMTTASGILKPDDMCYTTGRALIRSYGYKIGDVNNCFIVLIALLVIVEALGYFALRLKTYRAK